MNDTTQNLSFTRGRLPHWLVAEHAYFVTLCRKGCLPAKVVEELKEERAELMRGRQSDTSCRTGEAQESTAGSMRPPRIGADTPERRNLEKKSRLEEQRRRFLNLEAILDAVVRSERDLCTPSVSKIILQNLDWLRGRGWRVWAATLMPSHLHLVVRNTEGRNEALRQDLALFMSYTARLINAEKGTSGGFWQREPFDHWCRDGDAWLRSMNYTVGNPVKAGLCSGWKDWPHTVVDPEASEILA